MPNKLNNINIISIWEKQFSKIQHIISSENQNITLKQIETNFPEQSTITPYSRYSQYSQEDKNKIVQHIQNKDKVSTAWLNSNPIDYNSHVSNSTFITSYKQRLGFKTIGNKKSCICGAALDSIGNHFFTCPQSKVRNKIRNTAHKHLKIFLQDTVTNIIKDVENSSLQLLKYEPLIDEYFPKLSNQNNPITNNEPDYYDLQENDDPILTGTIIDKRADIAIKNGQETILIDVTMTEATAKFIKSHSKAEEPANQAANVKMKKYTSTHNMNTPPTSNVKFFIASATTQGALSKDFKLLLKYLVKSYPENLRNEKLQQIYQRLSSKIHSITSDNLLFALEHMGTSNQNHNNNNTPITQNNFPPILSSSTSSSSSLHFPPSLSTNILPIQNTIRVRT